MFTEIFENFTNETTLLSSIIAWLGNHNLVATATNCSYGNETGLDYQAIMLSIFTCD